MMPLSQIDAAGNEAKWPPVAFDGLEVVHDGNTESRQAVKNGENGDVPPQLSKQRLKSHSPSQSRLLSLTN